MPPVGLKCFVNSPFHETKHKVSCYHCEGRGVNVAELKTGVNPLFLRDEELRQGMELLFFAYRDCMAEAEALLDRHGLGQAHHRAIYFIGRYPGLSVGELLDLLRITKQSLSRVIRQLCDAELVLMRAAPDDRRKRSLRLTEAGEAVERELTEAQRARFARAYREAGAEAVEGFRKVLLGLADEDHRAAFERAGHR